MVAVDDDDDTPAVAADVDAEYPGTAVTRMLAARARARTLSPHALSDEWECVRQRLLWAAGLRHLPHAAPGDGNTGHSFNDASHVDATCMLGARVHDENNGRVDGVHARNPLGRGIERASLPELGAGGSWTTCMLGCAREPPADVAHVQFRARIAFKLVWCAPSLRQFVLVDDDGALLAWGAPRGELPPRQQRAVNNRIVHASKYARHAYERQLPVDDDNTAAATLARAADGDDG